MFASALFDKPWALDKWTGDFGGRVNLEAELAILSQAFPAGWCRKNLEGIPLKHPVAADLFWPGGRARLLALGDELLRHRVQAKVPMVGSLRHWRQYSPTVSEFLAAPLLAPLGGELIWQPEKRNPGCDYRVDHLAGILLGEVKRLSRSQRVEKEEVDRGA